MIHFKHIKHAVEGSLLGRVTQYLEAACPLQSRAWGTVDIWVCDQLFCKQQG